MKTLGFVSALLFCSVVLPAAEEVKASHILVRTQDEADVIRNEVIEKGGNRAAFMEAARKHSKDTTTKRAGGALGWFSRPKMVKEFSEKAFDMKVGEVSEPVQSQYGWHLILLEDRREQAPAPQNERPPAPPVPPTGAKAADPHAGHDHSAPGHEGHDHSKHEAPKAAPVAAAGPNDLAPPPSPGAAPTPTAEAVKVEPKKMPLPARSLRLSLDIKEKVRLPVQTVEVDMVLHNAGSEPQKVFAPELWPLGLTVAGETAPTAPPAAWDDLKSKLPEAPIVTLASRRSLGGSFTVNDYYKDLPPNGRYRLGWKAAAFFQNLEQVFPDIAKLPDYQAVKTSYTDMRNLTKEVPGAPARFLYGNPEKEIPFAVFDTITAATGKKYFASVEFDRFPGQPLWIELHADRQHAAVRQFADLALEGYYDWLTLFDVQKGNFIRTGCPKNNGTSGPEKTVVVSGEQKIPHEKGTVSMIARSTRAGQKEIGSIFFISRKPHPEWDGEHVPIGKIVSGEEVLDKVETSTGQVRLRKVQVVTGDKVPTAVASAPGATPPGVTPPVPTPPVRSLPVAKVKTSKGELTLELFEDDAPNTVSNFIELVEKGYFNPDPTTKKEMTFYNAVPGACLITGSPTNDPTGSPGHRIASETADNKKSHQKGVLTMLLEQDPVSGNPIPDSAGSQFMVCLQDIAQWNGLYTPFARITEGAEVLDKLAQGDKVESITIVSKRNRPYRTIKLNAPAR